MGEEKNYSLNIILKFSNFFASYTYADWVQVNCKNLNYDMVIAHGVTSLMTAKFFKNKNKNNYLVYDSIEIPSLMHEIENPTSISESFILSQLSNDLKVFDSYFTVSETFVKNFLSKKTDVNTCAIVAFKDLNKNRRISKIIEQIQEKYDFYIDVYCLKKPSNIEFFNKINYIEYD